VALVLPAEFRQTTLNPATILISRGDLHVTGVDFGVTPVGKTANAESPISVNKRCGLSSGLSG
jgi:hypothetical protein